MPNSSKSRPHPPTMRSREPPKASSPASPPDSSDPTEVSEPSPPPVPQTDDLWDYLAVATEKKFNTKDFSDEALVLASTETIGGAPSQKSLWAQAELTRRLMESIRRLDQTSENYSRKLLLLTIVLSLIALEQLAVTIFPLPNSFWQRCAWGILAIASVIYLFWSLSRQKE